MPFLDERAYYVDGNYSSFILSLETFQKANNNSVSNWKSQTKKYIPASYNLILLWY